MAQPVAVKVEGMSRGIDHLAPHDNLFVKQTRKGCLQEMMGCEAKNEFQIATMGSPDLNIMYAEEEATFCCRFFCKAQRTSKMTVTMGALPGGEHIMDYDRPFRCMPAACKCCCYQEMTYADADGQEFGSTVEGFYMCVPKFHILDENKKGIYTMQMPTCCGGSCVDLCAEGWCNCRIPFYLYNHEATIRGEELKSLGASDKPAQITKVWGGLATELFTDADKFEVLFPEGATPKMKGSLLGTVFFLNMNFFEKQKDQGGSD